MLPDTLLTSCSHAALLRSQSCGVCHVGGEEQPGSGWTPEQSLISRLCRTLPDMLLTSCSRAEGPTTWLCLIVGSARLGARVVWDKSGGGSIISRQHQKTAATLPAPDQTLKLVAWQAGPLPCGPAALPWPEYHLAVEAGGVGGAAQVAVLEVDDILQACAVSRAVLRPALLQEADQLAALQTILRAHTGTLHKQTNGLLHGHRLLVNVQRGAGS